MSNRFSLSEKAIEQAKRKRETMNNTLAEPSSVSSGPQHNSSAQAGTPSVPVVSGPSTTQGGTPTPPPSNAPLQFLLTDAQALEVFSAKKGVLDALADALDLGADHKSKPVAERKVDIVRLLGTSNNPEFDVGTSTFNFPDLCKQDFQAPTTQPPP